MNFNELVRINFTEFYLATDLINIISPLIFTWSAHYFHSILNTGILVVYELVYVTTERFFRWSVSFLKVRKNYFYFIYSIFTIFFNTHIRLLMTCLLLLLLLLLRWLGLHIMFWLTIFSSHKYIQKNNVNIIIIVILNQSNKKLFL
jgi:hypothetical protein